MFLSNPRTCHKCTSHSQLVLTYCNLFSAVNFYHPSLPSSGTTHSFSEEEKLAFVDWINYQLEEDADLKNHLPVPEEGDALFSAVHDGLILWCD